MKITIVDDEEIDSSALESCIQKYSEEYKQTFSIAKYNNVATFLNDYNDSDVVFLDIAMPVVDGMTAAKKLREIDNDVTIVFVTNMSQMAINGYEVRAFDFILKPLSYKNFSIRFTRILKTIRKNQGKDIWISNKDGKIRINTSKIKYVEIVQHILVFHMENGEYRSTGTLLSLQEQLKNEPFSMCNRWYFVNLSYVTAIKGQNATLGDTCLQISRAKKKDFLKDINDYIAMFGKG